MFIRECKKFLCRVTLERTDDPAVFDEKKCEEQLAREAVDWLFLFLSLVTYIYLGLLAFLFFTGAAEERPHLLLALDVMRDPYITALGMYVIVKELRKKQRQYPSRYWGESFVVLWMALLFTSTACVMWVPGYNFDLVYKIILESGIMVALIYIAGFINKP